MRVHIYAEESTNDIEIVRKTADTAQSFFGVRYYLASSSLLHGTPNDDDRSAVTFWFHSLNEARNFFSLALTRVFDTVDTAGEIS